MLIKEYYSGEAILSSAYELSEIPNSTGEFANHTNILQQPHLSQLSSELAPPTAQWPHIHWKLSKGMITGHTPSIQSLAGLCLVLQKAQTPNKRFTWLMLPLMIMMAAGCSQKKTTSLLTYWIVKQPLPSGKGGRKKCDVCVGDVVLLIEDNVSQSKWPYGLVKETLRSDDDRIKRLKVKTNARTILERPIQKLVLRQKQD